MKIALGTVQFGMSYGVSNTQGQVSKSQVKSILDFAYKKGITCLDTAYSYGESEKSLGFSLGNNKWDIITKTPHFKSQNIDSSSEIFLEQAFNQSLKNLGLKKIRGLLIHNCDDLFKPGGEKIYQKMQILKATGAVEKIGVSIYSGFQIDQLLNEYDIDIVQLPINILDQRLINSGHLTKLSQNNIEIHARSIFLQGLLLMLQDDIPQYFNPIISHLKKFKKIAEDLNMNSLELALSFVMGIKEVNSVVVGVNSIDQLKQIVSASSIHVKPEDFIDLSISDSSFIDPSNWSL